MKIDIERFRQYLEDTNKSRNTVEMYMFSIRQFIRLHGEFTKANATAYKGWLIGRYKPKTVNTRLMALNVYAEKVLKRLSLKVGYVREQQKPFLENVISDADYEYFKASLLKSGNARDRFYYFVIRFLAATGARISEFIQFKAEHVRAGHVDIYGKGGKVRRVYFPKSLREDALAWLGETGRASGFLWTGRSGERLTQRGIAQQLKDYARRFKIPEAVVYPHSFRHRFAKNFLERFNDITLLADLMGHESIETTRIYLRRTAEEQREVVDRVITW